MISFMNRRLVLFIISLSILSIYAPQVWAVQFCNTATVSADNRPSASSTATAQLVSKHTYLVNTATLSAADRPGVCSTAASMVVRDFPEPPPPPQSVPGLPLWTLMLLIIAIITVEIRRRRIFFN